jgi:hypothetical protein
MDAKVEQPNTSVLKLKINYSVDSNKSIPRVCSTGWGISH